MDTLDRREIRIMRLLSLCESWSMDLLNMRSMNGSTQSGAAGRLTPIGALVVLEHPDDLLDDRSQALGGSGERLRKRADAKGHMTGELPGVTPKRTPMTNDVSLDRRPSRRTLAIATTGASWR
jgi:hypothetical protein